MARLLNKVAVVTGAARGIGLACAESIGREGARVVVSDVDAAAGAAAAAWLKDAGIAAAFIACDVASKAQVDALIQNTVEEFGGIDIVVANAGELGPAVGMACTHHGACLGR